MIQYILEVIAFQLIFLIIYDFWLKRETFFQCNRGYLISTYVLSMVLPWVKIEALKTTVPEAYYVYPEFLWSTDNMTTVTISEAASNTFSISWEYALLFGGIFLASLFFANKLRQLYLLKKNGKIEHHSNFTQIIIANSQIAFSFFKSIFMGDKVLEGDYKTVIAHELVHIKQRHTYDLLFFELMRIVCWFNPLVYVYQSRVAELHEFIADAHVAKTNTAAHYQLLLSQIFETQHISFINQFFKSSLIKKRIVMLQKSKSRKIFQLKYLLLIPFITAMLFYTSCESELMEDKSEVSIINVNDVENLTEDEEQLLLTKLLLYSRDETLPTLTLRDELTTITFSQAPKGSYISGPNGELLQAKMIIDSNVHDENFSLFDSGTRKLVEQIDGELFPFSSVDDIPVFPGCENEVDKRACFQSMMQKHISKNFHYPQEAQDKGIQGRVSVMFVITKNGSIKGMRMRGPDKSLENEVARIISRLPEMQPGKQGGEAVNVPFSIPITFKLQDAGFREQYGDEDIYEKGKVELLKKTSVETKYLELLEQRERLLINMSENNPIILNLDKQLEQLLGASRNKLKDASYEKVKAEQLAGLTDDLSIEFKNAVPFEKVAQAPIFPGCEDAANTRDCFREKIQKHITKHFNYPAEAQENGIQGRVNIMFLISDEGFITAIAKRGPDKFLEDEAVRIMTKLPKMKPGRKANGDVVGVPYSVPITFGLK